MTPRRRSSPPGPRPSSPPVPLSTDVERGNSEAGFESPLSGTERGTGGEDGRGTGREDGFPFDPDFPQLPLATDPARMLEVFRSHLVPVPGRRVEIEDCVPFRFRCRQGTSRCVLQYTLRLRERTANAEGGRERRWQQSVTGVVYAREGEAERQWRESRATEPAREIPPEWLAV